MTDSIEQQGPYREPAEKRTRFPDLVMEIEKQLNAKIEAEKRQLVEIKARESGRNLTKKEKENIYYCSISCEHIKIQNISHGVVRQIDHILKALEVDFSIMHRLESVRILVREEVFALMLSKERADALSKLLKDPRTQNAEFIAASYLNSLI